VVSFPLSDAKNFSRSLMPADPLQRLYRRIRLMECIYRLVEFASFFKCQPERTSCGARLSGRWSSQVSPTIRLHQYHLQSPRPRWSAARATYQQQYPPVVGSRSGKPRRSKSNRQASKSGSDIPSRCASTFGTTSRCSGMRAGRARYRPAWLAWSTLRCGKTGPARLPYQRGAAWAAR
jgi:hypothetical protein